METFEQWVAEVEAIACYPNTRYSQTDVYKTPNGVEIHEKTTVPHNPFKPSTVQSRVFFLVPQNLETEALAAKYNGQLEEAYYSEEGICHFVFEELEDAYNFATEEKDNVCGKFSVKVLVTV